MYDLWWMILYLAVMVIACFFDIRSKSIPVFLIIMPLVLALCYRVSSEDWTWMTLVLSVLPGITLLIISLITQGKIGMADAILTVALGIGAGIEKCMFALMIALILNCLFSIILLILHKADKNTQIPFVPFLTAGIGAMACIVR